MFFFFPDLICIKPIPRVITNYSTSGTQNCVHDFWFYIFRGSYWSIYKVKEWGILLAQWMRFLLPPGCVNTLNCIKIWQNLKWHRKHKVCLYSEWPRHNQTDMTQKFHSTINASWLMMLQEMRPLFCVASTCRWLWSTISAWVLEGSMIFRYGIVRILHLKFIKERINK